MATSGAMTAIDFYVAVVCWTLALLFAMACRHKLADWPRFKAAFAAYQIVPQSMVTMTAGLLVAGEALVALGLFALQRPALVVAGALLVLYMVAIGINLGRGRRHIDCGCGDEPTPLSYLLLVRNSALAMIAVWAALVQGGASALTWSGGFVALVASLVGYGIYMAIEQLLANYGRYERLWLGMR